MSPSHNRLFSFCIPQLGVFITVFKDGTYAKMQLNFASFLPTVSKLQLFRREKCYSYRSETFGGANLDYDNQLHGQTAS
jgi:hypothetical protein